MLTSAIRFKNVLVTKTIWTLSEDFEKYTADVCSTFLKRIGYRNDMVTK